MLTCCGVCSSPVIARECSTVPLLYNLTEMLSLPEKVLFITLVAASLYAAACTFKKLWSVVTLAQGGALRFDQAGARIWKAISALVTQGRIIRNRKISSLLHFGVAWGFLFFLLVNALDILEGFITGFAVPGPAGAIYRLLSDLFSISVLVGVTYFLLRRFVRKDASLRINEKSLLHPKARMGIARDSLLVGAFILLHVGFRLLGSSFKVAYFGGDAWSPFANQISLAWRGLPPSTLTIAEHACWWLALGLIFAFLPYFPYTKHLHLIAGPLNFATRPDRSALGALEPINFEDQSIEKFGVATFRDLSQKHAVDALSCIMCNRCAEVCPASVTGKELSPAALEINKRYMVWDAFKSSGPLQPLNTAHDVFNQPLVGSAISESAVWACTSCGACVDVCPVGNEPMFDILNIRRDLVLTQSKFPAQLKGAFTGMERNGNPWKMSDDRLAWTKPLGFTVPTVEENPDYDVLYWVGCAGAFDPNAQHTARAIATVLHSAGVNFAVLGNAETCTGDTARRAGNEYLFTEMAKGVIEALHGAGADKKQIVTGCPHCLHTIGKEYADLGGHFKVQHHTQLINTLVGDGRLKINAGKMLESVTFHDPCYLGRHNGEFEAPRAVLGEVSQGVIEMARSRNNSFCCGAGGAQVWKEEEHGSGAVNINRFTEAAATGAKTLAIGCPFCARMLNDANAAAGKPMHVKDVAELVVEALA